MAASVKVHVIRQPEMSNPDAICNSLSGQGSILYTQDKSLDGVLESKKRVYKMPCSKSLEEINQDQEKSKVPCPAEHKRHVAASLNVNACNYHFYSVGN